MARQFEREEDQLKEGGSGAQARTTAHEADQAGEWDTESQSWENRVSFW